MQRLREAGATGEAESPARGAVGEMLTSCAPACEKMAFWPAASPCGRTGWRPRRASWVGTNDPAMPNGDPGNCPLLSRLFRHYLSDIVQPIAGALSGRPGPRLAVEPGLRTRPSSRSDCDQTVTNF